MAASLDAINDYRSSSIALRGVDDPDGKREHKAHVDWRSDESRGMKLLGRVPLGPQRFTTFAP
jgi:hypothetical protein